MEKNEITTAKAKASMQMQVLYATSIANRLQDLIGRCDNEMSLCGYNIIQAVNNLLAKENLNVDTCKNLDKDSLGDAVKFAMVYRLNTDNKEVFVSIRNEKRGDAWFKKVEVKPQAKGTMKIVQNYGVDIKRVHNAWVVHEGDEFTYPTMKGLEVIPPSWVMKSTYGKVVRVVVPIEYNDGRVDYRIADRETVATNIKAQIKQSLLSDKDRQKKIMALIQDYTLDELLECAEIRDVINETYTGLSKEEMITTKLINNAIKRVPINFTCGENRELYEKTFDNSDDYTKNHKSASEIIEQSVPQIEKQKPIKEIEFDDDGVKLEAPTIEPVVETAEEEDEEFDFPWAK